MNGGIRSLAPGGEDTPPLHYLFVVLAPLLWAGNFVIGRALLEVDPFTLNFLRWAVAGVCLIPVLLVNARAVVFALRTQFRSLVLLSVLGIVGFNFFLYSGLDRTPAGVSGVLFGLTPLLILIISKYWGGQTISWAMWIGTSIALVGVAFVLNGRGSETIGDWIGLALVAISAVVFALYTFALQKLDIALRGEACLAVTVWIGLAIMAPIAILRHGEFQAVLATPGTVPAMMYLGIAASIVAFCAWQRSVKSIGPKRAGAFLQLVPVFSVMLGYFVLDEYVSSATILGLTGVIVGILISQGGQSHIDRLVRNMRSMMTVVTEMKRRAFGQPRPQSELKAHPRFAKPVFTDGVTGMFPFLSRLSYIPLAVVIFASPAVGATVLKLDAISVSPTVLSDFSLTFDDLDGDMLYSEDELVAFSGVSFLLSGNFYDLLRKTPTIAGFTDGATTLPQWSFQSSSGGIGIAPSNSFTYRVSELPPIVPLPAAALLLVTGFGGLAVLRRRKTHNLDRSPSETCYVQ